MGIHDLIDANGDLVGDNCNSVGDCDYVYNGDLRGYNGDFQWQPNMAS